MTFLVMSYREADADAWRALDPEGLGDEAAYGPDDRIGVWEGERLVGAWRGRAGDGGVHRLLSLRAAEGLLAEAAAAAADRLAASGRCDRLYARTETPKPGPLDAALTGAGFDLLIERVHFARELRGFIRRFEDPFDYRALEAEGRTPFVALLRETMTDGPARPVHRRRTPDFERFLDEMIAFAGDAHAAKHWLLGRIGGEPAGILLAHPPPSGEGPGMILHLGVAGRFRGRGLGKVLHERGLAALACAGCATFEGSTDSINAPMLRVFAADGCRPTGAVTRDYLREIRAGGGRA